MAFAILGANIRLLFELAFISHEKKHPAGGKTTSTCQAPSFYPHAFFAENSYQLII